MTSLIVLAVVLILIFFVISIFNNLVKLKNRYQNAFAQIEVQLKRRYDLIPNLVETAKAYMAHERDTLEAVINARNAASAGLKVAANNPGDPAAMSQLVGAESALQGAMSRFNVVMEAYPDLKANQNMMQVSEELTSTENRVAFARQAFNDAVTSYNSYKQSFPQVVLAPSFGHATDAKLMEFEDSQAIQAAPKVSF
ncbi:LemA family protein [Alkalimonas collagenimarina]|uniref:LemA family protein n=1 Tax=Alkalimonas collagenimarina TaxID=400390 RepID=A0ABT9GZ09_9GAMM|nr:LemA family protein [Alkalimonas collagenimarina]MDP4536295.1 LemA family protein [Alkalimonas collagenimarina]